MMRNPLSLEALAEWLESQPPEKEYDYTEGKTCLLTQYLATLGYSVVNYSLYEGVGGHKFSLWEGVGRDFDRVAIDLPETFGAAAQRARALLAKGGE